jgi:hypothetical protein
MTTRSFERAVRDWLEDGSDRTPPAAIDAVLLTVKTTPQQRVSLPRRFDYMPAYLRLAAAAAVIAAVGIGAFSLLGGGPGPGGPTTPPSPSPTPKQTDVASPVPTVPPLSATFVSPLNGYAIDYPAAWSVTPAAVPIDRDAFAAGVEGEWLDQLNPVDGNGQFRMGSVTVPNGVDAMEWIAGVYLRCTGTCLDSLIRATFDGQAALVREDNLEREMILILGDRAYFATLFPGPDIGLPYAPELFEAMMASLDLRPDDAAAQPSPSAP